MVLTILGNNSMHSKPSKILFPPYTALILEDNSQLVPAQHSDSGVMQKGEFLWQLRQKPRQVQSIGAETLKAVLSLLVVGTNKGAAG